MAFKGKIKLEWEDQKGAFAAKVNKENPYMVHLTDKEVQSIKIWVQALGVRAISPHKRETNVTYIQAILSAISKGEVLLCTAEESLDQTESSDTNLTQTHARQQNNMPR